MIANEGQGALERVGYAPPALYNLDIEVFRVSELWQRRKDEHFRRAHRIDFNLLVCVTAGSCRHTLDFAPIRLQAGSVLMARPGQAQQFDVDSDWDGWLILFQPEFLLPSDAWRRGRTDDGAEAAWLGQHLRLEAELAHRVQDAIAQLRADSQLAVPRNPLHALLRHQLQALLIRLGLIWGEREAVHRVSAGEHQRYRRFQLLLEQQFRRWHQVQDYARALACSEKTLNRAVLGVADDSAKAMIIHRIMLEAKRLLAHTALPVAAVAEHVGFDEATNFTKFFRREAAMSPGEFRKQHGVADGD